jgi:hypothetical protein
LTARGIDKTVATKARLGYVSIPEPGHERFQNRLAIPYLTPTGPVDIKYRCVEDHDCEQHGHHKYDKEPGYSSRLYGVHQFRVDSDAIAICEGELDALVAAEHAGIPAVGIPGLGWKPHYQYLFEGYADVIVVADPDQAGRSLVEKISKDLYNVRSVELPEGTDVNSFFVAHGAEALRDRLGLGDTAD